jgi:PIN domain nuclease of toxin-antitoxin system
LALLLDTHAFLWWLAGDARLSRKARLAVGDPAAVVLVSAASVWEITTKHRLGKLPGVATIVHDLAGAIASQAFTVLPITAVHAQRAGLLAGPHRDPFDRMLIAQARSEDLELVSNERVFDSYGVSRVW